MWNYKNTTEIARSVPVLAIVKNLEDFLLEGKFLTEGKLRRIKEEQIKTGMRLDEVLIKEGFFTDTEMIEILALNLDLPSVSLSKLYINIEVVKLVPEYLARKYIAFPIKKDGNSLVVAMSDPLNIFAVDDLKIVTGHDIQVVVATKKEIQRAIEIYYNQDNDIAVGETDFTYYELEESEKAPIIRLVNTLIHQAVKNNASDIHIEPQEHNVRVRYRLDGQLSQIMVFSKATHQPVVTRIKIMAGLDIAKKRTPQDGSFKLTIEDHVIDIRLSIIPTINGEKIVLRVLNRDKFLINIDQLGFNEKQKEDIYNMLRLPHGIILVVGPTGSGKTTTLYSMLSFLNQPNKNIVTLEDPIEYALPGINQVQINPKSGITFANGLRAILRQDPNIIMVGEIRDRETADIAIRAALTGHLVLSTLHTSNASGTIGRLLDMGIESYLLASCLAGIISQRLVRRICPNCKEKYKVLETERNYMDLENEEVFLYRGKGCSLCNNTGYKGRQVIGEVVNIHPIHRNFISRRITSHKIEKAFRNLGYLSLKESGIKLVEEGITTLEEITQIFFHHPD